MTEHVLQKMTNSYFEDHGLINLKLLLNSAVGMDVLVGDLTKCPVSHLKSVMLNNTDLRFVFDFFFIVTSKSQ